MTYPVSEIFQSIQGEGHYVGAPTAFVRLAGCPVGKRDKNLKPYEWCRTWDGRRFLCDTDFRKLGALEIGEILERVPENGMRCCITGGEPLIHDLEPLVRELLARGNPVSIETSGTIVLPDFLRDRVTRGVWITCSPKAGYRLETIRAADELKMLVGPGFEAGEAGYVQLCAWSKMWEHLRIFLQPVNGVHEIDPGNAQSCLELLSRHPRWRLSAQMHKALEVE